MQFLTLEYIKQHSRIDFNADDELLTLYANAAEDTIFNICNRTYDDIVENFGTDNVPVPYAIIQAGLTNAETDSSSTTYATINLTRNANAVTQIYYNFDFSSIPSGATIDSVTCTAKCYISTTNSGRVATRQVQLFSGTTAKGSAATVSNTTTAFSVTAGTWTRAELQNAKIRVYAVRGTSNVTTNYYFRFYGATVEVTYTEASTGNKVYIKSSGTWKQASKIYVKVSGTWKEVSKVFKKVNGAWVEQSDKSAMFDPNAIYKKG